MTRLEKLVSTAAGRFIAIYAAVLLGGFVAMSLPAVNTHVIDPYTSFVAEEGRAVLNLFGEGAVVRGQTLSSPRFAVQIYNGCNGLEAILVFVGGVLAFPAPWRRRLLGALTGFAAIQVLNVVRVVSLFYIGVFKPAWFSVSHVFVWQTIIILASVVLWLIWVRRYALAPSRR